MDEAGFRGVRPGQSLRALGSEGLMLGSVFYGHHL